MKTDATKAVKQVWQHHRGKPAASALDGKPGPENTERCHRASPANTRIFNRTERLMLQRSMDTGGFLSMPEYGSFIASTALIASIHNPRK